ncbi:hypothetical protein HPP92_017164 [Vanilla planifolia]|uniref:Epidermal patterning factor-like protein n=1 Tax=Vanilla planifolia TaxID=51239 RepID=A0A835QBQ8_VANPL|nr:hypothetical protein HPP92_017691 [Vanilla planifolia]KAG0467836.1 hypothetical protein HPP92_017164 [Vanilla planifolia]
MGEGDHLRSNSFVATAAQPQQASLALRKASLEFSNFIALAISWRFNQIHCIHVYTSSNDAPFLLHRQHNKTKGRLTARFMIGSRPPNCERKCLNCRRCDAIQVPTSPQETKPAMNPYWVIKARRDDSSNYKPMSWKCKCGNHFFNP